MSKYKIEVLEGDSWQEKEFCLRQAVALLRYSDAKGRKFARVSPIGKTFAEMESEFGTLGPDEDCKGCNEEAAMKPAAKRK